MLILMLALSSNLATAQAPRPSEGLSKLTSCHAEPPTIKDSPVAERILSGYGSGGFVIDTRSRDAQMYFDNGMQLGHAFAHKSAVAAFRRAEQIDPSCAMCLWGEAWARGPSINFTIDKERQHELDILVAKAAALSANNPPIERELIAAMQKRYRDGGGKGAGDAAYALAMDAVYRRHPLDNEIAILAADAWMIPAAQQDTREHLDRAIQILESVLRRSPNDTGAIHFYIHATEMDGVGAEALPYAERLQALTPASSHLVHMPSHVYFWLGRYREAEQANLDAVKIDNANALSLKPKGGVFAVPYHDHSVLYGQAAALMDGDAHGGLVLAGSELQQLPAMQPDNFFQQFGLATAYEVYGRYGSAKQMESLIDPGPTMPYARAMWHYARGEFAARSSDVSSLSKEIAAVQMSTEEAGTLKDSSSEAQALIAVARLVLTGRLAMVEKRWSDAEASYRAAAGIQEEKLTAFTDPPAWWYPIRRSVAAALLSGGDSRASKVEVQQALLHWPSDPLSLELLADSEAALGHSEDAKVHEAIAAKNWVGDIRSVTSALF
jgi:tetratricopeptide (TPR) repeat protein